MKKYICNPLWLLLLFVAFISSCDKEEIVFDHELPQFELRSDAILLEVIMPQGTGADEIIYIAGDFNGGQDAASGDLKWQMEKAANNDGFFALRVMELFFGQKNFDVSIFLPVLDNMIAYNNDNIAKNGDALHQISAKVGTRTDITVTRWNAYFEEPEDPSEVIHDGYAVFVMDNTGWDALTLYAWGNDLPELFGGWPGISPTGSVEIKGITYKYFDTGEANKGLTYNLIMNNNNGGSQFDLAAVTLDRDYYFRITDIAGEEIDPNNPDGDSEPESEAAFVSNQNNFLK